MRSIPTAAALLTILLLTAAKEDPVPVAARAVNEFAFDLHRKLPAGENVFFSPYSVSAALAMTREGARGETGAQMDRVFHWEGRAAARLTNALDGSLAPRTVRDGHGNDAREVPAYELHTANAVWAQEGLPVDPGFKGVLTELFGAPLRRIDFRETEKARAAINDWVEEQTKDRIKDIVPEGLPTPDTLLTLANAIYFKGAWNDPFKERFTKKGPFTTAAGAEVRADFMNRTGEYRYAETGDVQVLEIPYRKGDTSMLVFLPRKKGGLAAIEAGLRAETFDRLVAKMSHARVAVKLPKFEMEFSEDLADTLPGMGMPDAFIGGKADFSGMTKASKLFIGAVLHKAWVKVDEAGTEAAAATVVMMLRGGMPSGEPIRFTADRPFLFAIRHTKTSAILFLGRVVNPGN